MQLQISIKDDKAELFLQILKEFGSDMVEKYQILKSNYIPTQETENDLDDDMIVYMKTEQFKKDKEYFQKALEEIESGEAKLLNQAQYSETMKNFRDDLRVKYANY